MIADTNIADGIAVKLLLAGLVLASAAVGAAGLAHVAPQADADGGADGLDADAPQLVFPIDNVTFAGSPWDVTDTDPAGWLDATPFRTQDMDPY